jgi:hypothetical protein
VIRKQGHELNAGDEGFIAAEPRDLAAREPVRFPSHMTNRPGGRARLFAPAPAAANRRKLRPRPQPPGGLEPPTCGLQNRCSTC